MIPVGDRPVENLIADVLFLQLLLYGIRVVDDRLPKRPSMQVAGEIPGKLDASWDWDRALSNTRNGISPGLLHPQ